jgi:tRNA(Arg) A34 adenosine deaminase TadA
MHTDAIDGAMRRALELAWESTCAGSLGIGCVITDAAGEVVASGRNRLFEHDSGDDHLAGTSLAHAEMNALAKLRWGLHRDVRLVLHTTLQPCLQCLAAIRMSAVDHVVVLAPDPLFRGVEAILDVNDFVASRRPSIEQRPIDTWSVVGLMLPTHAQAFWSADWGWADALPMLWDHARELVDDKTVIDCATAAVPFDEVLQRLEPRLAACVDEVVALARS